MFTKKYNKIFILLLVLFGTYNLLLSQNNQVPEEAKKRTAPFLFDKGIVEKGELIYTLNCKSCHGNPGKGDFAKLVPIPKDPATPEYQANTDGEMFYILTNGRGLMPTFANTLSEEQRWEVISYVRSFNKSYKQPAIQQEKEQKIASTLSITFHNDSIEKKFYTIVIDNAPGNPHPVRGVKVSLFVKRTFGNLPVGEGFTDSYGVSGFNYLTDIPGDNLGNLALTAKLGNDVSKDTILLVGKPTIPKEILATRAWWNINAKAPVWLITLYTSGIIIVLGTLIYILLLLKKIRDLNHKT